MIPEYPKFKALEIDNINEIAEYLEAYRPNICELNKSNLIIWKEFDSPSATTLNGNLCILINSKIEAPYFLEPLGHNKVEDTMAECLKHTGRISRVSERCVREITGGHFRFKCLRDQFDYTYGTKDLAELKGKKYDGKRNQIKKFKAAHPAFKFEPLAKDMKAKCLGLFEKWFETRKETMYFQKLAYRAQKSAIEAAFKNFDELSLFGGALISEEAIKGFTMGSRLNKETACVHFAYADPSVRGAPQILISEAANNTFADFELMNLEQDMGIPGLRKAKLSWHPVKLEKKFEIKKL